MTDSLGRRVDYVPSNGEIRVWDADGTQRTFRLTSTELIFPDATGAANGLRYRFQWKTFNPIKDPNGNDVTNQSEVELEKIT